MNVDCVRFKNRFGGSVLEEFKKMDGTTANCGDNLQDDTEVYDAATYESLPQFTNMPRCSILLRPALPLLLLERILVLLTLGAPPTLPSAAAAGGASEREPRLSYSYIGMYDDVCT